jgi:hypothetical protein
MSRGGDPAPETPAALREMAARGRRLARNIVDRQAIRALTEFAEELEARAVALETTPHHEAAAVQRSDPDLGRT